MESFEETFAKIELFRAGNDTETSKSTHSNVGHIHKSIFLFALIIDLFTVITKDFLTAIYALFSLILSPNRVLPSLSLPSVPSPHNQQKQ